MTAVAAVAPIRPSSGHKFFPPKAHTPAPSVTSLDLDLNFIDEPHTINSENEDYKIRIATLFLQPLAVIIGSEFSICILY
jgi:hypothetical protein